MLLTAGGGGRWLNMTRPPLLAWTVAMLLFAGVELFDVLAPPEVAFSAFYLMPVIWLAWSRGSRDGLIMALLVGAGWYAHDLLSGRPMSSEYFRCWDALNKVLSYLLAAWVVGALRQEVLGQQALNQQLTRAMAEVRELKGLLPVCAWCHNIRDETGQWHTMAVFLAKRTHASATHGICPVCVKRMFAMDGPEEAR